MIKELIIEGFESWKDKTNIPLSKGVNVFVGDSDHGKSGIVRSNKLVDQNRPQGDEYKNDELTPKQPVRVTQIFSDGSRVERRRIGTKNSYVINGDTKNPLKALRTDIPTEVQDITRMKKINIQGQHPNEQYFLLGLSPGKVAKEFNDVAGLSIMDKAMSTANKRVRKINTKVEVYKEEIKLKEIEIHNTQWVVKASKEADQIMSLAQEATKIAEDAAQLKGLIDDMDEIDLLLKKFKHLDSAVEEATILEKLVDNLVEDKDRASFMQNALKQANNIDEELKAIEDINEALNEFSDLEKLTENNNTIKKKIKEISFNIENVVLTDMEIKEAKKSALGLEKQFKDEMKTKGCPICGSISSNEKS